VYDATIIEDEQPDTPAWFTARNNPTRSLIPGSRRKTGPLLLSEGAAPRPYPRGFSTIRSSRAPTIPLGPRARRL